MLLTPQKEKKVLPGRTAPLRKPPCYATGYGPPEEICQVIYVQFDFNGGQPP